MDLSEAVVTCAVSIEWQSATGTTGRKLNHKVATLRLIRKTESRDIYVEVSVTKAPPTLLRLHNVVLHKKFMTEGKASIKFNNEKCIMYLSNAPPGPLVGFFRTMVIKLGNLDEKDEKKLAKGIKAHMLSGKPSRFEEISPVTNAELMLARKAAKAKLPASSLTTPSPQARKRSYEEMRSKERNCSAAKKLYDQPAILEENHKPNEEQQKVLQACLSGKNIFFTGSAGTGKSFLLKKIIQTLPPEGTVATASTGVAACLIGGVTLHSFAGIGGGEANISRCYEMASRPNSAQNWRRCKRLIIDEISMVDGQYFEKIEKVARHIKKNDKPFGGIQLILCGDFLQLPPVVKRENNDPNKISEKNFCFQSEAWEQCIQVVFELKEVHRQTDPEFVKILNHIRIGHVNEDISKRLLATSKQVIEMNGILATQLCSHTSDAHLINESKLEALSGDKRVFRADDSDPSLSKQLDSQIQAPYELVLKIGAQVMLLKNINISIGLVNGARGILVRYEDGYPVVRFKNNNEYTCKHEKWSIKTPGGNVITRKQVPLKLAWAFSIHKSQGLTLDCVEMSLAKVFEAGQAYVALSRAKSLDSLRILDFDSRQVWANSAVLQFYKSFRKKLYDIHMIPLGDKNRLSKHKSDSALTKFKKSLMNRPLVSIS